MTITVTPYTLEYDRSARAWSQFENDGMAVRLVKNHETREDAIKASLPPELAAWVESHEAEPKRVLRAAVLLANGELVADTEGYGQYSKTSQRKNEDGELYRKYHYINAVEKSCTCEDYAHAPGGKCKHVLAARYLFEAWHATHLQASSRLDKPEEDTPNLFELAKSGIESIRYKDDLQTTILWIGENHIASLVRHETNYTGSRMKNGIYLNLILSSCPLPLRVAELRPAMQLGKSWWHFCCRKDDYNSWADKISQKGKVS